MQFLLLQEICTLCKDSFSFLHPLQARQPYDKYRGRFKKVMKRVNQNHKPHDTRHTFITKGKYYQMDDYILKMIVGHAINDVTEKTYTHRVIEELRREIEKIIE